MDRGVQNPLASSRILVSSLELIEMVISSQGWMTIDPVVVLCTVIAGILGTTISDFSIERVISGRTIDGAGCGKKKY